MNSVNANIEALTWRGSLQGVLGAYVYAAFLVAGPWIFTVVGLFYLNATPCEGSCTDLTVFRSIVIYNSMYALVVTSPLAFISGRYVSEQVHARREQHVFYALVLSFAVYVLISLAIVAPFYIYATTLSDAEMLLSVYNAMMIGSSWLLIPFLGSFRGHNIVLAAFGAGCTAMLLLGRLLPDPETATLLLAFNGCFAITNVVLLFAVVRRFGRKIVIDPELKRTLRSNWELPAAGLAYALGLWIDKIIMWRAAPSGGLLLAGALKTMPSYDTAMFWAQLSSIPVIAICFVHVETRFSALLRSYHTRMQQRATLRELNEIAGSIETHILSSMFGLFAALIVVSGMMVCLSFVFMAEFGLLPSYMATLRAALVSTAFYTSAMFCFNLLLHLNLRRPALQIVLTFLVLNTLLTCALLPLGPDMYGYGNMFAAAFSLLIGVRYVMKELSWLHYHAFITNNSSA
ncbi:MAG: pelG [Tardiphaga sp.]|jgi:uncharacterized membrane protein|nr:pelG [Tardiphaga sp.]